jgi:serine/threonine-protein kinase HipA
MSREIHVFGDWEGLDQVWHIGLLRADRVRGKEIFSFDYDQQWLESGRAMCLDPDLHLYPGPQYLAEERRPNFGAFLDSSPDRWGKLLMKRKESMSARGEKRQARQLMESDFLLDVHDVQRIGGLRFKESPNGPFLAAGDAMTVPPWTQLRELEEASWQVQSEDSPEDLRLREWLTLLMAPGSSIGGARPKAGVCDEEGNLWIAKFPGRSDEWNVSAWEMVVHELARGAGIDVANARIERFARNHHTYMTQRFDRRLDTGKTLRRHFASAMTMLGYGDGADHSIGVSYLEIVEFLMSHGAEVDRDLNELWRRIVFSIYVNNIDDHLRNHGFLLEPAGWRLSPAYDLNPEPFGTGLSLNISENDNSLSVDLAMEVRPFFRLSEKAANNIINEIQASVTGWRDIARRLGISNDEQEQMSPAFETS